MLQPVVAFNIHDLLLVQRTMYYSRAMHTHLAWSESRLHEQYTPVHILRDQNRVATMRTKPDMWFPVPWPPSWISTSVDKLRDSYGLP